MSGMTALSPAQLGGKRRTRKDKKDKKKGGDGCPFAGLKGGKSRRRKSDKKKDDKKKK